jgi:glycosyltransferase involved in cell wall biosynthesis
LSSPDKTVLVITYYWPPAGGPGVQRVLKTVKYLAELGWRAIVLTPAAGEYPAMDASLEKDIPETCRVVRTRSVEPYGFYKGLLGVRKDTALPVALLTQESTNWKKRFSNWIRMNLFIPDAKIGWKFFAVRAWKKIIREEKPDILFSSSPPHSLQLVAERLSAWSGIPWVADFRDPWTNIYHYEELKRTASAQKKDKRLEQRVLHQCDQVTAVSEGFFPDFDHPEKMTIIPNGYDPADQPETDPAHRNEKFTIRYMGSMKTRQYVDSFFRLIRELADVPKTKGRIEVELIGRMDPIVPQKVRELNLEEIVHFAGYMEHDLAMRKIAEADMLLLVIGTGNRNRNILTSKLFEYLMMKKPILAYGPTDGMASRILQETQTGTMFECEDLSGARSFILNQFAKWQDGKAGLDPKEIDIEKYSRKNLTRQFVELFKGLSP